MKTTKNKVKAKSSQKIKKKVLFTYYSCNYSKTYHPLKRKKINRNKIKTIADAPLKLISRKNAIRSKKYIADIANSGIDYEDITGKEDLLVQWLNDNGESASWLGGKKYILNGKECSASYLLIIANKKRIQMKLKPFFINWISEC